MAQTRRHQGICEFWNGTSLIAGSTVFTRYWVYTENPARTGLERFEKKMSESGSTFKRLISLNLFASEILYSIRLSLSDIFEKNYLYTTALWDTP